jgi:hypothetical protein
MAVPRALQLAALPWWREDVGVGRTNPAPSGTPRRSKGCYYCELRAARPSSAQEQQQQRAARALHQLLRCCPKGGSRAGASFRETRSHCTTRTKADRAHPFKIEGGRGSFSWDLECPLPVRHQYRIPNAKQCRTGFGFLPASDCALIHKPARHFELHTHTHHTQEQL